jgi:Tfp pilus assembly protein PilX
MSDGRYFDDENADADVADRAVNVMARRQFGISLIVALALLAAAGLMAVGVRHETPVGMAARHPLVGAAAARAAVAQAAFKTMIAE